MPDASTNASSITSPSAVPAEATIANTQAEISSLCAVIRDCLTYVQPAFDLSRLPLVDELLEEFWKEQQDLSNGSVPDSLNKLMTFLVQERTEDAEELAVSIYNRLRTMVHGHSAATLTMTGIRSKLMAVGKQEVYGCQLRNATDGSWDGFKHSYVLEKLEQELGSMDAKRLRESRMWEVHPAFMKCLPVKVRDSVTVRRSERKLLQKKVAQAVKELRTADKKLIKCEMEEKKAEEKRLKDEERKTREEETRRSKEKEKEEKDAQEQKKKEELEKKEEDKSMRKLNMFGFMAVKAQKPLPVPQESKSMFTPFYCSEHTTLISMIRCAGGSNPHPIAFPSSSQQGSEDFSVLKAEFLTNYVRRCQRRHTVAKTSKAPKLSDDEDDYPVILRFKFLHFEDNFRPAYYGSWRKTSSVIRPRQPLVQDSSLIDYEVESDIDWEEAQAEDAESIRSGADDDDVDSEENEYYSDDFCIADEGIDEAADVADDQGALVRSNSDDNSPVQPKKIKNKRALEADDSDDDDKAHVASGDVHDLESADRLNQPTTDVPAIAPPIAKQARTTADARKRRDPLVANFTRRLCFTPQDAAVDQDVRLSSYSVVPLADRCCPQDPLLLLAPAAVTAPPANEKDFEPSTAVDKKVKTKSTKRKSSISSFLKPTVAGDDVAQIGSPVVFIPKEDQLTPDGDVTMSHGKRSSVEVSESQHHDAEAEVQRPPKIPKNNLVALFAKQRVQDRQQSTCITKQEPYDLEALRRVVSLFVDVSNVSLPCLIDCCRNILSRILQANSDSIRLPRVLIDTLVEFLAEPLRLFPNAPDANELLRLRQLAMTFLSGWQKKTSLTMATESSRLSSSMDLVGPSYLSSHVLLPDVIQSAWSSSAQPSLVKHGFRIACSAISMTDKVPDFLVSKSVVQMIMMQTQPAMETFPDGVALLAEMVTRRRDDIIALLSQDAHLASSVLELLLDKIIAGSVSPVTQRHLDHLLRILAPLRTGTPNVAHTPMHETPTATADGSRYNVLDSSVALKLHYSPCVPSSAQPLTMPCELPDAEQKPCIVE
jgi:hypothetical protein